MNDAFAVPGYQDVELIGAGGFGRVYRARQPAFDRTVAVKLLNGKLDDAATERRFQRECQALGSVSSHPNIVQVFDAGGTPGGQPYLVMDYVRGGSLADRLARSGPLPWDEVASIGVKMAGALHSAHAAGVLHRDIKPENILVSGYGEPQLADFGIAQRAGIENRTTTAAAMTPSHTAPEQFSGSPPSERTDVYALASTLYTLLAGRPPFAGRPDESIFALIARAATDPVPDVQALGVPGPLAQVIEQGLVKDPAVRPASALAFGRLLQQAQQALGVPVTPVPVAHDDESAGATGPNGATWSATPGRTTLPPGGAPAGMQGTYPPGGVTPGGVTPGGQQGTYPPGAVTPGYPPAAVTPGYPPGGYPSDATRPWQPGAQRPPAGPGRPPPEGPGQPQPGGGRGRSGRLALLAATIVALAIVTVGGAAIVVHNLEGSAAQRADVSSTPDAEPDPSPSGTDAADGTDAGPSTGAGTGPTGETPSDGGPTGALDRLLLEPGKAPLQGFVAGGGVDAVLIGDAGSTEYFCKKTVSLGQDPPKATASMSSATGAALGRLVQEQLFRPGRDGAAKALTQVRASARCGLWDSQLAFTPVKVAVAPGAGVTAGDEAVAYTVTTDTHIVSYYQVFFRKGEYFGVITVVAVATAITGDDRTLAVRAAQAAVQRLP